MKEKPKPKQDAVVDGILRPRYRHLANWKKQCWNGVSGPPCQRLWPGRVSILDRKLDPVWVLTAVFLYSIVCSKRMAYFCQVSLDLRPGAGVASYHASSHVLWLQCPCSCQIASAWEILRTFTDRFRSNHATWHASCTVYRFAPSKCVLCSPCLSVRSHRKHHTSNFPWNFRHVHCDCAGSSSSNGNAIRLSTSRFYRHVFTEWNEWARIQRWRISSNSPDGRTKAKSTVPDCVLLNGMVYV